MKITGTFNKNLTQHQVNVVCLGGNLPVHAGDAIHYSRGFLILRKPEFSIPEAAENVNVDIPVGFPLS